MARTSAKSVGISLKRLSDLTSVSFAMNQDTLYGIAQRQRPRVRRLNREMHSLLSYAHEWSTVGGSFWGEHWLDKKKEKSRKTKDQEDHTTTR